MEYRIENCANSAYSALKAQKGGAYRVELCAGIPEGGTTPSYGEIKMARKYLTSCKLNIIIRPRGGDFLYSDDEIEIMVEDILQARELGVDGIAVGCLTKEGEIDMIGMRKIMDAAKNTIDGDLKPLSVTCHRAFDVCANWKKAMEDLISLGCDRILSSGQEPNALKGKETLAKMVQKAAGRIIIMPGCGVNPDNIVEIAKSTGAKEFHFSGRSTVKSKMEYRNPKISMGGTVKIEEYSLDITNSATINKAVTNLASIKKE